MACPSGIDIPAFIKKLAHGNEVGAARTILTANILGASCARVCPTAVLCEGACVLDDRDEQPIQIGRLQRYATDFVEQRGLRVLPAPAAPTGQQVAVLGAGPAGLACAAELSVLHTHPHDQISTGLNVVVIGAGNTAIDAATQAKRLGAERAVIIYRRSEADMSAYAFEYQHAKDDNTEFIFHAAPVEVLSTGGHVTGLKLVQTRATSTGRMEFIPGTEWIEPCDLVLKAVGQEKQTSLLHGLFPSLALDELGAILRDPLTGATNRPHVFTGGDCANGGREVVNAVGEGKKAAHGIHAFLTGTAPTPPVQPSRLGAKSGPTGSGLLAPIRAHELEAALQK
jgi:NADPH-dependent glutamate synthase beta subunit-like oxidoreductase